MAINFVPGPEAQLAPALKEIADGVMNYIKPNAALNRGLQQAMLANPGLIVQLGDVSRRTPNLLPTLGVDPELMSIITGTPESAASITERNVAKRLTEDPTALADATERQISGRTTAERRIQETQADVTEATAELELPAIKSTIAQVPTIGEIDLYDVAKQLVSGEIPDDPSFWRTMEAIHLNPGTKETFDRIYNTIQDDVRHARTLELAQFRSDLNPGTISQNRAYQMYIRSDYAGSPAAWQSFLENPDVRLRAAELAAQPPGSLSLSDRELADVFKAEARMQRQAAQEDTSQFLRQFNTITNSIRTVVGAAGIDDPDDPRIAQPLAELNILLGQRAAAGGPLYKANFGIVPGTRGIFDWRGDAGLYFTDESGQIVPEGELFEVAPIKNYNTDINYLRIISEGEQYINQYGLDAFREEINTPGNVLDQIVQETGDPGLRAAVMNHFGITTVPTRIPVTEPPDTASPIERALRNSGVR